MSAININKNNFEMCIRDSSNTGGRKNVRRSSRMEDENG